MPYSLNPDFIFYFENQDLIIIHLKTQRSFKMYDPDYIQRFLSIFLNTTLIDPSHPIDAGFIESGLLMENHQISSWAGDKLSSICHMASRNLSDHYPFLSPSQVTASLLHLGKDCPPIPDYEPVFIRDKIKLPPPDVAKLKSMSLDDVLRNRKTCRDFYGSRVLIEDLATLLYYCFGYLHGHEWNEFEEAHFISLGKRKSSPSSTGLQVCDAFIVVMDVEGIQDGIYFYHAQDHTLQMVTYGISTPTLISLVFDQFWVKGISFGIFITIDLRKIWVKDQKTRGYVTSYMDCGHVSQTVQLVATALQLQTWVTGSFRDEDLMDMLKIREDFIFPGFFVGVGHGSNKAIPRELAA